MRAHDVVVAGAGLIGLALARDLHRAGLRVLVLEKERAAHGASWAGAGMLAAEQSRSPYLRSWGRAAAALYPEFLAQLEAETGMAVELHAGGTVVGETAVGAGGEGDRSRWRRLDAAELRALEPGLDSAAAAWWWVPDASIDNRRLGAALVASVRARGIALIEGDGVRAVTPAGPHWRVETGGGVQAAAVVVNAAGAWAGELRAPEPAPVRPRKGQMLALATGRDLRCVVHAPDVYLVPRAGGRVLVGATIEDAGFAEGVDAGAMAALHAAAVRWMPALRAAPTTERWAGFRPGTPDDLPLIGETAHAGYWLATGHFRDGILLAPLTAQVLAGSIVARLGGAPHGTMAVGVAPAMGTEFDAGLFRPRSFATSGSPRP